MLNDLVLQVNRGHVLRMSDRHRQQDSHQQVHNLRDANLNQHTARKMTETIVETAGHHDVVVLSVTNRLTASTRRLTLQLKIKLNLFDSLSGDILEQVST